MCNDVITELQCTSGQIENVKVHKEQRLERSLMVDGLLRPSVFGFQTQDEPCGVDRAADGGGGVGGGALDRVVTSRT